MNNPEIKRKSTSVERLGITLGIFATLGLVIYFLIMALLNLEHVIALRFVNYLIITGILIHGLKKAKATLPEDLTYFQGLGLGIVTGISTGVLFAFFMFFYMRISSDFFLAVQPDLPFTVMGSPGIIAIFIFIETFIATALLSFVLMQYFKSSKHF